MAHQNFEIYWMEATVVRIITSIVTLGLFILWRKKKARVMYQAWALLGFVLNIALLWHNVANVLDKNDRLFISVLFFINSLIVIYRSWQDSTKYLPLVKVETKKVDSKTTHISKQITVRAKAWWETIKNGGNNHESQHQIKKDIRSILRA